MKNYLQGMAAAVLASALAVASPLVWSGDVLQKQAGSKPAPGSMDWPQWRGPNRDGIAPGSPKLLDQWPSGGPTLLWRNQNIGSGADGGSGSPVIADGKVYIYANTTICQPGKKLVTAEVLADWGWTPEMPPDLAKKIEEARLAPKRKTLKTPAEIEAYAKEFTATLDPKDASTYGALIKSRFARDPGFFTLDELNKLSTIRDKDFKTVTEFMHQVEKLANMHHRYGGCGEALDVAIRQVFTLSDVFVCLDAATGKELWRKDHPAEGLASSPQWARWGASGTPAVAGGRLIVQGSVALYCLSAKDGTLVWKTKTSYSNSSPLVAGRLVLAGAEPRQGDKVEGRIGGALSAYDLETGKALWRAKAGHGGWGGSVAPWTGGGKNAVFTMGGGLFCVDAENGGLLADTNKGEGVDCWATPAVSGDIVVSRSENVTKAYKIALPKMEKLWESKNRSGDFESASPLIYQGAVYVADHGSLRCLDLKTGEQKWMAPKDVNPESSTPLVVDGKLITNCGSNHAKTNETVMLRATSDKCEVLGRITHPAAVCTSPAVAGGRLYVRLIDGVACYDLSAK